MDDATSLRWYGAWEVVRPTEVGALLTGFDRPWWVAGGWAVEAFTGVPRDHDDIDVCVFQRDADALRRAVGERFTCWSVFDGAFRPFCDEQPEVHPDAVQLWLRRDAAAPWSLDVLLNPDQDGRWVNRRDPAHTADLADVTWVADDGVR